MLTGHSARLRQPPPQAQVEITGEISFILRLNHDLRGGALCASLNCGNPCASVTRFAPGIRCSTRAQARIKLGRISSTAANCNISCQLHTMGRSASEFRNRKDYKYFARYSRMPDVESVAPNNATEASPDRISETIPYPSRSNTAITTSSGLTHQNTVRESS